MYDEESRDWVNAERNRPLTVGDRLQTERGARSVLHIGSVTLRMDESSELQFDELNDQRVRVKLVRGSLALRVRSTAVAQEFEVLTNEGRLTPLRAGHMRIDARERETHATAYQGALRFESRDSSLDIESGKRAELWYENGRTHYSWGDPARDNFSDWVADGDERSSRDESRWAARDVSPEMTGVEDLDRYGQWDRHPEYGTVWYPSTVVAGWAPYRYGRWVWTNPWGWTWVDAAPWGFAPFHYGRWVMYGGRWAWAPGRYVARPVYSPALVGWVGSPGVSVNINVGGYRGAPPYGWVPLGPRDYYAPHYRTRYPYDKRDGHGRGPGKGTVPTGPIMYTNEGVPGGVTTVGRNYAPTPGPKVRYDGKDRDRDNDNKPKPPGLPYDQRDRHGQPPPGYKPGKPEPDRHGGGAQPMQRVQPVAPQVNRERVQQEPPPKQSSPKGNDDGPSMRTPKADPSPAARGNSRERNSVR